MKYNIPLYFNVTHLFLKDETIETVVNFIPLYITFKDVRMNFLCL